MYVFLAAVGVLLLVGAQQLLASFGVSTYIHDVCAIYFACLTFILYNNIN